MKTAKKKKTLLEKDLKAKTQAGGPHISVLLNEVIEYLNPENEKVYVDCTFGAGGYTKAILDSCNCKVIGIDRDENVLKYVDDVKEKYSDRFEFLQGRFSDIKSLLKANNIEKVDGIVMDLGVSSMQLDESERGFSFMHEAPLDMRMGKNQLSAYDVVNKMSEQELADIIYHYGEEVKARQIAKSIVAARSISDIKTTTELADLVGNFYPKRGKTNPATKTFQAIRIYVNRELDELKNALESSKGLLKKNGRLVVVSFHSLEDSIVKKFMRDESGYPFVKVSKYKKDAEENKHCFSMLTKKAIKPTDTEIKYNPRSRSSRLRAVSKN